MKTEKLKERIPILLVEDDNDDIHLTERAFSKGKILNKLYVVNDGKEAMDFLLHQGRFTNPDDAPRPGVILLDLNMPLMDGREVLRRIKSNEDLRRIPVVVLTTSNREKDILEAYDSGANTFITKPVEFDTFLNAIITMGKYWLSIAEVPDGNDFNSGVEDNNVCRKKPAAV